MSTMTPLPSIVSPFPAAPRRRALLIIGGLTVAALACHARRSFAADAGVGARAQPEPTPAAGLELRLSALQSTYTLEGNGHRLRQRIEDARRAEAAEQAAEAAETDERQRLRKAIGRINHAPEPLPVRLSVEVGNRTAAPIEILPNGNDTFKLRLVVKGPAVAVMQPRRLWTMEFRAAQPVRIAPGKAYRVLIPTLAYGARGDEERAYWTRPGTYSITATLVTAQKPAPPGVQADEEGFARVTLTSNDVRVKVQGTKLRR
jgi:hypothetical protein